MLKGNNEVKAFIFSGQGSEYNQMAKELYENNLFAKELIDNLNVKFKYKEIFVEESELIHDTRYSQIGVFVISIVLAKMLSEKGIRADACAGLSLGEYTALCYAGAISIEETIDILENRSNIMYDALKNKDTGMCAIMFLSTDKVEEIVKEFDKVWVANYNSPDQVVIAGDNKQLEECSEVCIKNGAKKVVKLDVAGAFHSEYLKEASNELKKVLEKYNFKKPSILVYFNVVGNKSDNDIEDLLVNQLYNPVKFKQSILNMMNDGVDEFYVIGVGSAIDSFIRSIAIRNKKKVKVIHIEKMKDLEAVSV